MTRTVIRNALFGVVSQLLTWGLAWVLLVVLPRELGDEDFGRLFFAISFAMVASIFLNLGINTFLTREVARDPAQGPELLANALGAKLLLAGVVYAGMLLVVRQLDVTQAARDATDVIGLAFLVGSIGLTYSAYLQGMHKGSLPSLTLVAEKAVITVASVALLHAGHGLLAMAWVQFAGSLVGTLLNAWLVHRETPVRIAVDRVVLRRILLGSLPFLVWVVFGEIYVRIDVLMLTSMTNDATVGWYGAAFRLYGTVMFIPNVFMTSVFPAISSKFTEAGDSARNASRRSMSAMLLTAVPVGLGTALVARPMVAMLFGLEEYGHAVENLEVFGLSMVLVCVNVVLGTILIANDRHVGWAKAAIGAAFLNPLMNLVLIPLTERTLGNGGHGAALATLATEGFLTVIALRLLPRDVFDPRTRVQGLKILVAGVVMMLAVLSLDAPGVPLAIGVGACAYLLAIVVLRVVPKEDVAHVKHAVLRRT